MVGQKQGPFVFNRIDIFAVGTSSVDNVATPGFSTHHVGYPQIDNLDTPMTDAWNKQAVKKISDGDCGDDGDIDTDYEIGYANENLISTSWSNSQYCHGTPHGMWWGSVENLVLRPSVHKLKPNDVFGGDDRWIPKFQNLVWQALSQQEWSPPKGQEDIIKAQILSAVIKPAKWGFVADGLQIGFSAYEGGCYVCTSPSISSNDDLLTA